jgi:LysR family transcriptional regulator, glycine cleavage system transcriptional activator
VHRLGRFSDAHPEITLRISADMHHVDFAREDVDVAVRHGEGNWPGLDAVRLASEQLLAVCSPALSDKHCGLRAPADLLKLPLLHLDAREAWGEWFAEAGIADADVSHGPVMNKAAMVIDAAVSGQGAALARSVLAASDLLSGRLVQPFRLDFPLRKSYWIVCPKANAALPKIRIFRDWLIAEAADDTRRLSLLS